MHECGSVRLTYVKHRIFDEMEAIGFDGSVLSIEDTLNVSLNVEISASHDEEEESRSMFNIYLAFSYLLLLYGPSVSPSVPLYFDLVMSPE